MQESTLLKIALLCSVIGVAILYIISSSIKVPDSSLLEKDKGYLVKGTISRITEKESVTYLTLQKEDELTVILFKDYPVDLNQGDYVEVKGTTSESDEGEIQLIGKEVRVVK